MTSLLVIGGAFLTGLVLLFAFAAAQRKLGASEAIAAERAAEAEIAKKQAAILAERRTPEDAAKRLDSGTF